jgi:hypothetical protein
MIRETNLTTCTYMWNNKNSSRGVWSSLSTCSCATGRIYPFHRMP